MDKMEMMRIASGLLSDDGENPEYDRGVTELLSCLLEISIDERDSLLIILRAIQL